MSKSKLAPTSGAWRSWSRGKKLAVVVGVILVMAAIGSVLPPTEPATSSASPTPTATASVAGPFTLTVEAEPAGLAAVDISGSTNLPPGSVLTVFASRGLRYTGESDDRSTNVGSQTVTIAGSSFALTLPLDESNVSLGVTEDFALDVVSEDVIVCAQFQTGKDLDGAPRQVDPDVVAVVGAFGEQLATSPQVTVFGSATDHPANWLEATAFVALEPAGLDEIARLQGHQAAVGPLDVFCVG